MQYKEVILAGSAFLFIFLGFDSCQQYLAAYFDSLGMAGPGFLALLVLYLTFVLSLPLSGTAVARLGTRNCMLAAVPGYCAFLFSVATPGPHIYFTAALAGLSAALLWTGVNTHIAVISRHGDMGKNSGLFLSLKNFGPFLGIIMFGHLALHWELTAVFSVYALAPLLALPLLSQLTNHRTPAQQGSALKVFGSKTALCAALIWFAAFFAFGLSISILPVQIARVKGLSYLALVMPLFYILPVLASYLLGDLSDRTGRRRMLLFSFTAFIAGLLILIMRPGTVIFPTVLLALAFAGLQAMTFAMVGDLSPRDRLPHLTALFWVFQNSGVVCALVLSSVLPPIRLFIAGAVAVSAILLVQLPFLKRPLSETREKIRAELQPK